MEEQKKKSDNIKEETFCGFCRNVLNEGNFTVVEKTIKGILDILFVTPSTEITNTAIMCDDCSIKLFAAFDFKTKCVETEDCIFHYLNSEKDVDLREVYLEEKTKEHLNVLSEDDIICRLCMEVVTCGFTPIKELDIDTFCGYIPEVNFSSTKEPVICRVCLHLLDTHTNFLKSCLETERIKCIYEDKNSKSMCKVNQEETETESETNNDSETWDLHSKSVDSPKATIPEVTERTTKSKSDDCSCSDCKHSPAVAKKPIESELKTDRFVEGMYICGKCHFKSKEKEILEYHNSRLHGEDNVRIYNCDECRFKTSIHHWLVQHKSRHRSSPSTYKCDVCDYTTSSKGSLNIHVAAHAEKKWKCNLCNFQTDYRRCLANHARAHKTLEELPTYECEYPGCEFRTVCKSDVQKHLTEHLPKIWKCDSCSFQTWYKDGLIGHARIHKPTGALPRRYKCEHSDCQFKTMYKKILNRHLLSHKKQEASGPNSASGDTEIVNET